MPQREIGESKKYVKIFCEARVALCNSQKYLVFYTWVKIQNSLTLVMSISQDYLGGTYLHPQLHDKYLYTSS